MPALTVAFQIANAISQMFVPDDSCLECVLVLLSWALTSAMSSCACAQHPRPHGAVRVPRGICFYTAGCKVPARSFTACSRSARHRAVHWSNAARTSELCICCGAHPVVVTLHFCTGAPVATRGLPLCPSPPVPPRVAMPKGAIVPCTCICVAAFARAMPRAAAARSSCRCVTRLTPDRIATRSGERLSKSITRCTGASMPGSSSDSCTCGEDDSGGAGLGCWWHDTKMAGRCCTRGAMRDTGRRTSNCSSTSGLHTTRKHHAGKSRRAGLFTGEETQLQAVQKRTTEVCHHTSTRALMHCWLHGCIPDQPWHASLLIFHCQPIFAFVSLAAHLL